MTWTNQRYSLPDNAILPKEGISVGLTYFSHELVGYWSFHTRLWVAAYASLVFFSIPILTKQFFGDCFLFILKFSCVSSSPSPLGVCGAVSEEPHGALLSTSVIPHAHFYSRAGVHHTHQKKTAPVCPTQDPEPLQIHAQPYFPWTSRSERISSLVYHKPVVTLKQMQTYLNA